MKFGEETIGDYGNAIRKEWLLTNGLGGYASSTILGINTRKYHGLLIAPLKPPWDRKLLLSKLEEEISLGDEEFQLSTNEYPGLVHPQGYRYLREFRLDPFPTFALSVGPLSIEKKSFMPHGTNTIIINYKILNQAKMSAKIRVYPLINSRSIHELTNSDAIEWKFEQRSGRKSVELVATYQGAPILLLGSDLMRYEESKLPDHERWYRNMQYREERERGYEYSEDHYRPGTFELELNEGKNEFNIMAAGGFRSREDFARLYSEKPDRSRVECDSAIRRLDDLAKDVPSEIRRNELLNPLVQAADSFLVKDTEKSVIAGYPWFSTWGRDTLLSLPGLTLVTHRYDLAKNILLSLAKRCKNGLIPNRFGDGWAEYNSADASLLFFHALHKYLMYTDDIGLVSELWPVLSEVVECYVRGANGNIRMERDGLIWSAAGLTWMDVKLGERFVTPREGKAVEINALWYNALKFMEKCAKHVGRRFGHAGLAAEVKESFVKEYWNREGGYLYDVIGGGFHDARLRPNQLFAVCLPFQLIEGEKARSVVSIVTRELLTPFGIRSSAKGDPSYRGIYGGGVWGRDAAYHQGTAWGWLLGPFFTALRKVDWFPKSREWARGFLDDLLNTHLWDAGLGTISEIFDGDEPHTPRGCTSQAWSVAEVLRCYVEDIMDRRPAFEEKYA